MNPALETLGGLGALALKVFIIVVPLLILLEWIKSQRWFGMFIGASGRVFSPIGFKPQSIFPLMTGVLFGISYGAGVLIQQSRSGQLDAKQVFLIAVFLGLCHAIVEDTLLFVILGANVWVLVLTRIVIAVLVVLLLSRLSWPCVIHQADHV